MRTNEASVKELMDKSLTFWTFTIWENEASMKGFRGSSSHRNAMQHLPKWCNEASYHHWIQEDDEFPSWNTISEKLFSEGRLSKVSNPSKAQVENQSPPIKWTKTERRLK